MKQIILALMLAVAGIGAAVAANPIREGNMISGHVLVKGSEENIPYATVLIVGSGQGTVSNEEGQFEFKNLPAGKYTLRVSAVGYKTQEKAIEVNKDFTAVVHFQMEEESFMTDEVVVSANRNEVSRKAAPVVVNVMSAKLFEMVNSRLSSFLAGIIFYTREVLLTSHYEKRLFEHASQPRVACADIRLLSYLCSRTNLSRDPYHPP